MIKSLIVAVMFFFSLSLPLSAQQFGKTTASNDACKTCCEAIQAMMQQCTPEHRQSIRSSHVRHAHARPTEKTVVVAPISPPPPQVDIQLLLDEMRKERDEARAERQEERERDAKKDADTSLLFQKVADVYLLNAQTAAKHIAIDQQDANTRAAGEVSQANTDDYRAHTERSAVHWEFWGKIISAGEIGGGDAGGQALRKSDQVKITQNQMGGGASVGDVSASTGAVTNTSTSQSNPTISNTVDNSNHNSNSNSNYNSNSNKNYNKNTSIAAAEANSSSSSSAHSGDSGDKGKDKGHHGGYGDGQQSW